MGGGGLNFTNFINSSNLAIAFSTKYLVFSLHFKSSLIITSSNFVAIHELPVELERVCLPRAWRNKVVQSVSPSALLQPNQK